MGVRGGRVLCLGCVGLARRERVAGGMYVFTSSSDMGTLPREAVEASYWLQGLRMNATFRGDPGTLHPSYGMIVQVFCLQEKEHAHTCEQVNNTVVWRFG